MLRYIRDNNTLGFKYYDDKNYAPLYDLLRQASIKTENQLMAFSDSSWKYCVDAGRITGSYLIFYQGGQIDHVTHVSGPVAQSGAENEYNEACTLGMALAHFSMLINEFLNKGPDKFIEEAPLIILDGKYSVCMAKNGQDTNHTSNIDRRVNLVRNGERLKFHKIYCC